MIPILEIIAGGACVFAGVFIASKTTKNIGIPDRRTKKYREESDIMLQSIEDSRIDHEIEENVRQMMHSYTHGDMIIEMPMNLAYKIHHKPTAKYLDKNASDIVKFRYKTQKDVYDLEHGPVTCRFMQSLKKPQF